ncbi:MAG TPA: hypothetical protein VIQ26_05645 [Microbacteriaceae bacterium]
MATRIGFAVAALFALLYGYDLFEAVSDTVGVTSQIAAFNANAVSVGLQPVAVPWAVLVAALVLPPVLYTLAFWLGRRLSTAGRALVFTAGLCVVAALTLSLTTFAGLLAG